MPGCIMHETPQSDFRDGPATGKAFRGTGELDLRRSRQYVAGFEIRGRLGGRPYPGRSRWFVANAGSRRPREGRKRVCFVVRLVNHAPAGRHVRIPSAALDSMANAYHKMLERMKEAFSLLKICAPRSSGTRPSYQAGAIPPSRSASTVPTRRGTHG
jgi:hypothetical protein